MRLSRSAIQQQKAESAKFEAEQLATSTDGVAILEPWKHIFPPHICQVLLEACPLFPGAAKMHHWSFPDPSKATGSEAEHLAVYRHVRDDIRARIESALLQEAGSVITPAPGRDGAK
jgi:protein-tyrosine-phosphatase